MPQGGPVSHQYPQQQPGPYAPPPKKKSGFGKVLGLGCAGVVGIFVVVGIVGAMASGGDGDGGKDSGDTAATKPAATAAKDDKGGKAAADPKKEDKDKAKDDNTATFKVWGTAPSGALGGLDIMYGSDSDTRKGEFKNGKFEATMPVNKDALYFSLTAQLQGSGDIHCSVTIGDKTKNGHASGGYNICDAQLNAGLFGGWDS
jgi:hypothetical protein